MNRIIIALSFTFLSLLVSCGGGSDKPSPKNYLDSLYRPALRVAVLESLRVGKVINEESFQALKSFTGRNSKKIAESWKWGDVLTSANGYAEMDNKLRVFTASVSESTDMKVVEFHYKVTLENNLAVPVQSVRGYFELLDSEGKVAGQTPEFVIEGPVAAHDSIVGLRLEYAHDKPTGNELSDKKLSEFREQLDEWVKIVSQKDPARFRFVKLDLELENGLSQDAYWLKTDKERGTTTLSREAAPKRPALYAWTDKQKEMMGHLTAPMSGWYMIVTPVLTNKVEATHGKWLIFDRLEKIKKYYVGQKDVPSSSFNPAGKTGELRIREIIDFWGWPMEIRIYEGESW